MSKKVLIVGGVAGGASTAARLRRVDEEAEIIIFEKGEHISFANCGLPYHIGEVIKERDKLLVQTPEAMEARFDIDVRVMNEVLSINRGNKEVKVKDWVKGEVYTESYDVLVLSPGADPIKPPLPGIDGKNIFTLRNIPDTDLIKGFVDDNKPENAVVVGAGYIGVEMAENLHHRGVKVSVVELAPQVLGPIDADMAAIVHNHMRTKGVDLHLSDGVKAFREEGDKTIVELQSGKEIKASLVVMSIGVKPSTKLAKEAGLELGETGAIKVNKHLQTSDESIYAIGDAIEVVDFVTKKPAHIPLAGPANKQGRIVANNLAGAKEKFVGTQGTAIAKVFDLTVAATGNNEKQLKEAGIDYQVSYTNSKNHAGYYPGAIPMTIKIIFTPDKGKLLGAQIVGYDGVDKRIDILATAIRFEKTVFDLQELELAYAPPFGSAKDPVNMAGFTAGNILKGMVDVIYWHELEDLSNDTIILDVREEVEVELGKIDGSINIPLNSLRDRLDELDKDKNIVIYCAVGLRGYIGARILIQHGFKKVKNLSGGYKLYKEIINDKEESIGNCNTPDCEQMNTASNPEEGQIVGKQLANNQAGKRVQLDTCGLQCPGPIMQVANKMKELDEGDILEVVATDPGFIADIGAWCKSTGNKLIDSCQEGHNFTATIQKGQGRREVANGDTKNKKTMVVFSGELDRAIASFIIANGAAAMGSEVTLFFTFWGLNILRKKEEVKVKKSMMDKMFGKMMPQGSEKLPLSNMNMFGMGAKMIRKVMKDKGVDSLEALIGQAKLNGVRLVACQMSMDVMGIKKEELIEGVEVGGVASFLSDAEESNMSLFI
ncbi:pyridine nucleotide-disulfide oxidoreductase [Orenia metallireducens]|uniref:Pyridine nucleotide-disulfide oxidoreductase n=1 Tax=Orenia metallireducens TaxID=1413210 RepID=A0A1C0A5Y1_9FIRM|nr:pyridine nucleotide-disulfide oxidoreductase [Orenia metallireducens]